MGKAKELYIKMSTIKKIIFLLSLSLSSVVFIVSFCGLIGIIDSSISSSIVQPIVGIVLFINGLLLYKQNKTVAILLFCGTAFILVTYMITFFIKS